MKKFALVGLGLTALTLASCAPRYSPQGAKLDGDLTCTEIRAEVVRAQNARAEAQKQKGLSGQNVAWALFFLPGIIGNEYNNTQVIKAADERIATLNSLYTRKECTDTTP